MVPDFVFSVVYFARGTLPTKKETVNGHLAGGPRLGCTKNTAIGAPPVSASLQKPRPRLGGLVHRGVNLLGPAVAAQQVEPTAIRT